jgi:hypothetical protein
MIPLSLITVSFLCQNTKRMNVSKIYWCSLLLSLTTLCMHDNNQQQASYARYALVQAEAQKDAAGFFIQTGIGLIVLGCINSVYSPKTEMQFNYCVMSLGAALAYGSYLCHKRIQTKQHILLQQKNLKNIKKEWAKHFSTPCDTMYLQPHMQKCS